MGDLNHPRLVLVSGCEQFHHDVGALFESEGWSVRHSRSFAELTAESEDGAAVVVADYALPDGSWTEILAHIRSHALGSEVVVYSRLADEHLWAEVMCLGGFDVISDASDRPELLRIASAAWLETRIRNEMLASFTVPEADEAPVL